MATAVILAVFLISPAVSAQSDDLLMSRALDRSLSVDLRDAAVRHLMDEASSDPSSVIKRAPGVFSLFREGHPILAHNAGWIFVEAGSPAIPLLVTGLKSPNENIRLYSARAFWYFDAKNRPAASNAVAPLLRSSDSRIKCAAVEVFAGLDTSSATISMLGRLASSGQKEVQICALRALGNGRLDSSPVAGVILNRARDGDQDVAGAAITALMTARSVSSRRIESILGGARGPTRVLAAVAAAKSGGDSPMIGEALASGLKSPNPEVRYWSVQGIISLGSRAPDVKSELLALLDDEHFQGRCEALVALEKTGAIDVSVEPHLIEEVRGRRSCWEEATRLLGLLGEKASPAVPVLAGNLRGEFGLVDVWPDRSAQALVKIGSPSIPALLPLISSTMPYTRAWAGYSLIHLTRFDPTITSRLTPLLNDPDDNVRRLILREIGGAAGTPPKETSFALMRKLYESDLLNLGAESALAAILPLPASSLLEPAPASPVRAILSAQRVVFNYDEAIVLKLSIENRGTESVRIIKPVCSDFLKNTTLEIIRDPGYAYIHMNHSAYTVLMSPGVNYSAQLRRGESDDSDCEVQSALDTKARGRLLPWSFEAIGKNAPKADPSNRLPPGRYHVRARYRMNDPESHASWSAELSRKYGKPWEGTSISNTLIFDVIPGSPTVSSPTRG